MFFFFFFQERSLEFQREKEEKRQLEGRIAMLTGQMIGRGRRADGGAQGAVRLTPQPSPPKTVIDMVEDKVCHT